MTTPLRVGIAGYGVVGKRRRKFIDARPDMTTVAVCDRTFAGAGQLADGPRHYTSYRDLLGEDLDALFVCLTNDVAPEVTMAGLEHGLHVFCEKPPGRTVDDIRAVMACEQRHPGQRLKYGFNHRYHESVREALDILRAGKMGRVLNLRGVYGKSKFISFGQDSDWRVDRAVAGGGILLDQGIHMVDLMRLFGGEFTEVHAYVSNAHWGHDVEDNAYALMRSADGVVGMLHSTATEWRHRFRLEVALERGGLVLSGILSGSKSYGAETLTTVWPDADDKGDPREQTTRYNTDPSWADEIAEFAAAIRDGTPIREGSSEDALRTMETVYRIYRADPEWAARWGLGRGGEE
ncbi:MAG: Gfo/Idh/MocA family oxidoreductase [Hyphomicrobiales bacterium]|nr:Gfo/Idh/MocA family oxidoreductase [Hyphomicrobiales bacterium]MCP5370537.1 Gfo/Idh/MocA family oxidoreductase [Hyphomicrobiales bacterium]